MFGFGKAGDMQVILEKVHFGPGEMIKGKAILNLKKPQKAKQVRVVFKGEAKVRQTQFSSSGTRSSSEVRELHRFEMTVDGEKEYQPGTKEYPFEIKVPDPIPSIKPEGNLGNAISVLNTLSGKTYSVSWFVDASLDISGGRDISKKVQVNVG